jgi:hypothetical protein
VIVIFGGEVVAEMPAAQADEAALLRAAHNLRPGSALPEELAASRPSDKAAVQAAIESQSATVNQS